MKTKKLIEKELEFLIYDYGFKYTYVQSRGCSYIYENNYGVFKYYEWEQFSEKEFSVSFDYEFKVINFQLENPKLYSNYLRAKKKIFYDSKKIYWEMISKILKEEIQKSNTLFGLKINNFNYLQ